MNKMNKRKRMSIVGIVFIGTLVISLSFLNYRTNQEEIRIQQEQEQLIEKSERLEEVKEQAKKEAEAERKAAQLEAEKEAEAQLEAEIAAREASKLTKYVCSQVGVNIRTEPNIDSNIISVLNFNKQVTVYPIDNNDEWYEYDWDGVRYYIHSSCLSDTETEIIIEPKQALNTPTNKTSYATGNAGDLLGYYDLTAYCACSKCCGQWAGGATASGAMPVEGVTVACNSLAMGTQVIIYGNTYTVQDTGGMANNVIDIYFNSHEAALNFGRQRGVPVYRAN